MNEEEFKKKLKPIIKQVFNKIKSKSPNDTGNFPILNKFPQIKAILVDLLTNDYNLFIQDIYWVSPKPTTFKILLKNNQYFYLTHTEKSWIVKVEGKKYYLLNLSEEERAIDSIARLLSYGDNTEQIEKTIPKAEPAEETTSPEQPKEEEE